ncbi:MAG: DUF1214 domain-containing protein [Paracoccaceae bacterium]|nr:DUF1214 domain-containing protein [Paracoccaceae bacterium]
MFKLKALCVALVFTGSASFADPEYYPPLDPTEIYREMDLQTLIRTHSSMHPEVGFLSVYNAYVEEGSSPTNIGIMETSVDSRQRVLTANSETIYAVHPVNLGEQGGAVVLEVPKGMLGMANAPGWWTIKDIGAFGPDKGDGGKYLFTGPGFEGVIPDGFYHFASPANTILWLLRGFVENGDTAATVREVQAGIRTYSLADADNPPANTFYNTSGKLGDHFMDMLYDEADVFAMIRQYFELNGPSSNPMHMQTYSDLYDLGFFDETVAEGLLTEAATIGDRNVRTLGYNNRDKDAEKWPGRSNWQWANNFVDEDFTGRSSGTYASSQHRLWSFFATFNSVAMTRPPAGASSQYIFSTKDDAGLWLDGTNHYTLTIPANPPAKDFWSITVYDARYRSMVRDASFQWGVSSCAEDLFMQENGSAILHFAPQQPAGVSDRNWIETNRDEGFMVWFRTYWPTDGWYDNSWVLPNIKQAD